MYLLILGFCVAMVLLLHSAKTFNLKKQHKGVKSKNQDID